jgi:hypothetical protein
MMVTKGVTFNMSKVNQKEEYDFAMKTGNFSGYVKSLIRKDIEEKKRRPQIIKQASGGIKFTL